MHQASPAYRKLLPSEKRRNRYTVCCFWGLIAAAAVIMGGWFIIRFSQHTSVQYNNFVRKANATKQAALDAWATVCLKVDHRHISAGYINCTKIEMDKEVDPEDVAYTQTIEHVAHDFEFVVQFFSCLDP